MLKLATKSDVEFLYECYMAEHSNLFLLYEKMELDAFKPIIFELIEQEIIYIFQDSVSNQKIGMCKLLPLKHRNSHILYVGGVAISSNFLGQGLGKKLIEEIVAFSISRKYKRLELLVATFNKRAIKVYESVGFEIEGTLRNYTFLASENKYIDEHLMSKLL